VAIIAILAAIAIPQYQNYVTKSQFSESQTIADGLKTPIVEYFNQTGNCPGNANGISAAASYSGKYVTSATVNNTAGGPCTILIAFKGAGSVSKPLVGKTVTFTGTDNGGSFSWVCTSTADTKYKPQACQ
jgi:type IV pilus assembly protein PilA